MTAAQKAVLSAKAKQIRRRRTALHVCLFYNDEALSRAGTSDVRRRRGGGGRRAGGRWAHHAFEVCVVGRNASLKRLLKDLRPVLSPNMPSVPGASFPTPHPICWGLEPHPHPPHPCVTFRLVVAPLRGPGRSPVLPFACCVGSLLSVGRCGRCSCWCRFRVCGAQWLVCWGCAECGGMCRLRVSSAQ